MAVAGGPAGARAGGPVPGWGVVGVLLCCCLGVSPRGVGQAGVHAGAPPQFPPQPSTSTARYRLPLGEATVSARVVETRYGRLQGLHLPLRDTHRHLKNLNVWLGVPYATPPVGGNRFSPTRTPSPWEGVRPATAAGPACPQRPPDVHNETLALLRMPRARLHQLRRLLPFSSPQSEDCLYLNIYAPAQGETSDTSAEKHLHRKYLSMARGKIQAGESTRKPVLVFIHGESYEWNTGNAYDGSVLAAYADVVVVTVNYRLGILGFLNANPAPGVVARVANYGLMDQLAALHWLQQNAALFGGDPASVTLMGHGTGAACIEFLMVSPTSTPGLFHRAILLSGSALSSWALVEDPVQYAVRLAHQVNCSLPDNLLRDHEMIVDCLREAPLAALLRADVRPPTFLSAFGPSVDGVVIKHDVMRQLLTAPLAGQERAPRDGFSVFEGYSDDNPGAFSAAAAKLFPPGLGSKGYDLLFGVVTGEALFRFPERDLQNGFEPERRDRILRTYVRNVYSYHLHEIFSTAVNEYTDWERTELHPINTRDATVSALSDAQFVAPVVQMADLLSAAAGAERGGGGGGGGGGGASGGVNGDDLGRDHVGDDVSGLDGSEDGHGHDHHQAHGDNRAYFYVFDYQFKDTEYPQRMGTAHGEELPFVWGAPLVGGWPGPFARNYTKAEVGLSEAIIMYWNNFIRTGNPNPSANADAVLPVSREKNRFRGLTWGQYDAGHQKHLEISMKPRLKNHFRAHQLSVWLRLIPELHRAGMEDVVGRHNLFRNHHDPVLYDGLVRGPSLAAQGQGGRRFGNISLPESVTTLPTAVTTCIGVIHYRTQPTGATGVAVNGSDAADGGSAEASKAYSTALGVTIAIGCSLLILNMLIFAGVYYQRDRTRMEVKSLQKQQQQQIQQQGHFGGGGSGGSNSKGKYLGCPSAAVDVDREQAAMMLSAGTPPGPPAGYSSGYGSSSGGMYLATIKEQPTRPQCQPCQSEAMHLPPPPPPEMFQTSMVPPPPPPAVSTGASRANHIHTATLPRNAHLLNTAETSLSTPNGSLPYFSLPRSGCRSGPAGGGGGRMKQQQQQQHLQHGHSPPQGSQVPHGAHGPHGPPECQRLLSSGGASSAGGGGAGGAGPAGGGSGGGAANASTVMGVPAAALSEMRV